MLFLFAPRTDVAARDTTKQLIKHLDQRIPVLMDRYDIPGVLISILVEGEPVWMEAYGYADLAARRKMTLETTCRVESISKPVTAWGIMNLAATQRIDLDRPVIHYLKDWSFPESSFSVDSITVRQLLSHTAGLKLGTIGVRYIPGEDMPTLREQLTHDALLFQMPGQSYSYSNTGYNILELLIEEITGQSFAVYMQEQVLSPLGMKSSTFSWRPDFTPPIPNGYDLHGNPIPEYVYPDKAAGGLLATLNDITKFVVAGMPVFDSTGFRVLSKTDIQQLYQPHVGRPGIYGLAFDDYGLGYFLETLPLGAKAVAHGGQGSGWMTHFHAIPETGDGIVILCNSQRSWPFFSYILHDWSTSRGLGEVGMSKIATATRWLWMLIGVIALATLWYGGRLLRDFWTRKRRFVPSSSSLRLTVIIQAILSVSLLIIIIWASSQPYLFFRAVFPITSVWLGSLLFILALISLLSILWPRRLD